VWESTVDGRRLNFRLSGINNQNFLMRDEETGTWWQQVSGEAISGSLKGKRLTQVYHDEISFATWKHERPSGRVLKPDERVAADYEKPDWEEEYKKFRVVVPADPADTLAQRDLVAGIKINGEAKAYPYSKIEQQYLISDSLGGTPLMVVMNVDKKSVRAFDRTIDGKVLEFTRKADSTAMILVDKETSSQWDFSGKAVSGPMAGKQLNKIYALNDYWFDWKIYNPKTSIY
jgi:hypothetical protein